MSNIKSAFGYASVEGEIPVNSRGIPFYTFSDNGPGFTTRGGALDTVILANGVWWAEDS